MKRKPNLAHVKTFGVQAYVHVPKIHRTKLDPKARRMFIKKILSKMNRLLNRMYNLQMTMMKREQISMLMWSKHCYQMKKIFRKLHCYQKLQLKLYHSIDSENEVKFENQQDIKSILLRFLNRQLMMRRSLLNIEISGNKQSRKSSMHTKKIRHGLVNLPSGKKVITSTWVFKIKHAFQKNKAVSRLDCVLVVSHKDMALIIKRRSRL